LSCWDKVPSAFEGFLGKGANAGGGVASGPGGDGGSGSLCVDEVHEDLVREDKVFSGEDKVFSGSNEVRELREDRVSLSVVLDDLAGVFPSPCSPDGVFGASTIGVSDVLDVLLSSWSSLFFAFRAGVSP